MTDHGDVEPAGRQILEEHRGRGRHDADPCVFAGADRRGRHVGREVRRYLGSQPELQASAVGVLAGTGLAEFRECGQCPAGVREEQSPLLGQGDSPLTVEQADPEQGFQPSQALRQRRLGDAHPLCGGPEVLFLRKRDKDFQMPFRQHSSS